MGLFSRKKAATPAESAHMGRVKRLRCVCCALLLRSQESETQVHHIRAGGEPRNHWLTIPLCEDCHLGKNGVEKERYYLRILGVSEWHLLAVTISWLEAGR